ncbi:pimeloyl-ACP methyl ester carboxylesterase [Actinoplanes lutulentus]|uniref:Lipase (Class 2) n=1 Tax=Actinoplanes lutulentus TaxID=1287878 RepID=A0A327ZHJ3_9ACTN|nr:lipase [Actinoplanes lutulentus]MBB2946709.1 pimeloyl-ACP methyl ester carboxylesterase [Actinoplanes lutulentus]RAK35601.1 lipase (class 2) [Actinoplanes lutulentus]
MLQHRPRPFGVRALLLGALAVLVTGVGAAFAMPSREPGPVLAAATPILHCAGDAAASARAGRAPVLLIHGTGSNFQANFSWNWARALTAEKRAYCGIDLPQDASGDIQLAAEHVVRAIRTLHKAAGAPISIVGHSQGGLIGRWALKYWPDTRDMVDDYVSFGAPNHGTATFVAQCEAAGKCPAARWQQRTGSRLLAALNDGPQTWPGVDYTQVMVHSDEIVVPHTSSVLPAATNVTNIEVNRICPAETVEHFGLAYDNAAYLIGQDALTHPGPAQPARIRTARCGPPLMPAVDPLDFPTRAAAALVQSASAMVTARQLKAEPPLRCYADRSCTPVRR